MLVLNSYFYNPEKEERKKKGGIFSILDFIYRIDIIFKMGS